MNFIPIRRFAFVVDENCRQQFGAFIESLLFVKFTQELWPVIYLRGAHPLLLLLKIQRQQPILEIWLGQAMSPKMSLKDRARDMLYQATLRIKMSIVDTTLSKVANSLRLNRKL